jgi:hypothetical protein
MLLTPRAAPAVALIIALICPTKLFGQDGEVSTVIADVPGRSVEWMFGSPDGSAVAFAIRGDHGVSVYRDGTLLGTFEYAVAPLFSANSKAFCFVGVKNGSATILLNGKQVGRISGGRVQPDPRAFALAMAQSLALSADGSSVALVDVASSLADSTGTPANVGPTFRLPSLVMVLNGKRAAAHWDVGPPVFNPVKNEVSYRARDSGAVTEPTAYIIAAGVAQKKYYAVTDPVFSPDGSRLAYSAMPVGSNKWVVVIDGHETPEKYDFVNSINFSSDSKHIAYVVMLSQSQVPIIDGKIGQAAKFLDPIVFSTDGSTYGYVANTVIAQGAKEQNESSVIIGGIEKAHYKDARAFGPAFGPQGQFSYVLREGVRSFLITDSAKVGPYLGTGFPVYSPNGSHIAYGAVDGISQTLRVIIDGQASAAVSSMTVPRFLSDSVVEYVTAQVTNARIKVARVSHSLF